MYILFGENITDVYTMSRLLRHQNSWQVANRLDRAGATYVRLLHVPPCVFSFSWGGGGAHHCVRCLHSERSKGEGPSTTLAWPGWKQPDIAVKVDMARLETGRFKKGFVKFEKKICYNYYTT